MSVSEYELKSGKTRWQYVIDGPPVKGKRQQIRKTGYPSRTAAVAAEIIAKAAVQAAAAPSTDGTLAGEFLAWATARQIDLAQGTAGHYVRMGESYILPYLGKVKLRQLTTAQINQLYLELLKHGSRKGGPLSSSTVRGVHKTLFSFLNEKGYSFTGVRTPKKSKATGSWDDTQCIRFLRDHTEDRLFPVWALAIVCGMRRGELNGLRWSLIDLDRGYIKMITQRKIVTDIDKTQKIVEAPRKGRKADDKERLLPIGPLMRQILITHRVAWQQQRDEMGDRWQADDFLFVNDFGRYRGRPCSPRHFNDRFTALARQSGLPHIRLHDARHSMASVASNAGVDISTLGDMLGHRDTSSTMGYVHTLPASAHQAALMMEQLILPPGMAA